MLRRAVIPVCRHWQHSCTWSQLRHHRQTGVAFQFQSRSMSIKTGADAGIVSGIPHDENNDSRTNVKPNNRRLRKSEKSEAALAGGFEGASRERDKPRKVTRFKKNENLPEDWTEKFGTLAAEYGGPDPEQFYSEVGAHNARHEEEIEQAKAEPDFDSHIPLSRFNRKHNPDWYSRRIKKLTTKGQIKEALELFEEIMIKKDRVKPSGYDFFLLISALAQIGYTKKAFQLYHEMVQMGVYVESPIYTCLFTACANSPLSDGLTRARRLYTRMLLKEIQPAYITYQSMIRAFGMGGDINTAFSLADQAASLYSVKEDLLNSLLITCISDKDNGFRHAILVWRKFRQLGIKPDRTSYNLLLRAVKECGIVPTTNAWTVETMSLEHKKNLRTIQQIHPDISRESVQNLTYDEHGTLTRYLEAPGLELHSETDCDAENPHQPSEVGGLVNIKDTSQDWWELDAFPQTSALSASISASKPVPLSRRKNWMIASVNLPDILDPRERLGSVVSVRALETAEDRILVLGGSEGFMERLRQDDVTPDVITYSQLMMVIPSHQELALLSHMRNSSLSPDIDFYNHYIHKKAASRVQIDAKEMLAIIREDGLEPNMTTYGLLSSHCRSIVMALALLEDMRVSDMVPNVVVLTNLIKASYMDFSYKWSLLTLMDDLKIEPDIIFIETVERHISKAKDLLILKDRGKLPEKKSTQYYFSQTFAREFQDFLKFYDKWAKTVPMKKDQHPWHTFKKTGDGIQEKEEKNH